jgi:hypothetical protein
MVRMVSARSARGAGWFCATIVAGVGLLCLRNAHSLLVPTLYTEDGVWMAKLFHQGFWHTLVHAKGGETPYFVFLNILLLQAAKSLNALVCGESLVHLPRFVAALSMLFYALLAAAPVWLLRPFLGRAARILLWALVIFMPLGDSSFEVLGRLSNIGYGVLFLCFSLLAWRRTADRRRPWRIIMADISVFLCATTNPLCYPVVLADSCERGWRLWRGGTSPASVLRRSAAARSGLGLAVALALAAAGMQMLEPSASPFLKESVRGSELLETIVVRPLLFPFVFPIYTRLNDGSAATIAVALAGLAWWLTRGAARERRLLLAAGAIGLYAAVATVVMRPGLTHVLDGYSTTMLDRYYYGTSLFTVMAASAAISGGLRGLDQRRTMTATGCLGVIAILYLGSLGTLVECRRPRWRDLPTTDFAAAVTAASSSVATAAQRVPVQLHPRPWKARFPAANVRATAIAMAADTIRR